MSKFDYPESIVRKDIDVPMKRLSIMDIYNGFKELTKVKGSDRYNYWVIRNFRKIDRISNNIRSVMPTVEKHPMEGGYYKAVNELNRKFAKKGDSGRIIMDGKMPQMSERHKRRYEKMRLAIDEQFKDVVEHLKSLDQRIESFFQTMILVPVYQIGWMELPENGYAPETIMTLKEFIVDYQLVTDGEAE